MTVQYQVDGNIFREITSNWLCAYVNESLIKARQLDIDQTGNTVENFQLSDGRVFTRLISASQATAPRKLKPHLQNTQPSMREHSPAHSR